MKKIAILLLFTLAATGAFAQLGKSFGGGLLMDYSANNGLRRGNAKTGYNNFSFGTFIFIDATYAEIDVGFAFGSLSEYAKGGGVVVTSDAGNVIQFNFSVLGKYPVKLCEITIFPLFGISYNIVIYAKDEDGDKYTDWLIDNNSDFNQFGFLTGIGLDYDIIASLYFRAEALFHLRLPMKYWKDTATSSFNKTLGVGPQIKVTLGYKF